VTWVHDLSKATVQHAAHHRGRVCGPQFTPGAKPGLIIVGSIARELDAQVPAGILILASGWTRPAIRTARWSAARGSRSSDPVLAAMVKAASGEPGVEIYSYHRGADNAFWFFALMADEASMRGHGQSEAMQAAMSAFGPLVAAPPQMTVTTPVAALGLDL
jgi:quinol monooxygenase YgiN